MTINIVLKYNNGALLLADGRVVARNRIIEEDACKIFRICNNASVTFAGDASSINSISDLSYAAEVGEKHFKKLLKEGRAKKPSIHEMADIRITPFVKVGDEPENMTLEKLLINWDEKEIIPQETFRIYKSEKYKNQILFDIKSIGMQFHQFVTENAEGIIAGIDIKGPRVIQTYVGGYHNEKDWAVAGAEGSDIAEIYLEDYYKKILDFNQALELAIYCGVKSSKKDLSINKNFMAVNITEKKGKIISELVSKPEIDKIMQIYSNKQGSFEPLSK